MIYLKCVEKIRDKNGVITDYKLIDVNGNTKVVNKNILKDTIMNNQVSVVNLTLTSDGRLIDTSNKLLDNKSRERNENAVEQKKLQYLLNNILEATLLKVLKDHYIEYKITYSEITGDSNRIMADIQLPSLKLYKNQNKTVYKEDDPFYTITIVLEKEKDIYSVTAFSSLSEIQLKHRSIPKVKHTFIINSNTRKISATYCIRNVSYDRKECKYVNKEYTSLKDSLADISDYLSSWISSKISTEKQLPAKLLEMQANKLDYLYKYIKDSASKFDIEIKHYSNYNRVSYFFTMDINKVKVNIVYKFELNTYSESKVNALVTISYENSRGYYTVSKRKLDMNKTAKEYSILAFNFALDYAKYINCALDIADLIKEKIGEELFEKTYTYTGCLESVDDDNNISLNDYLDNKTIKLYIQFKIESTNTYDNHTNVDNQVYLILSFSPNKLTVGSITINNKLKENINDKKETPKHICDIAVVNNNNNYELQRDNYDKVFNRDSIFRLFGLLPLNLDIDTINEFYKVYNKNNTSKYSDKSYWLRSKKDRLNQCFQSLFNIPDDRYNPFKIEEYKIYYYQPGRFGYDTLSASVLNMIKNNDLFVTDINNKLVFTIYVKASGGTEGLFLHPERIYNNDSFNVLSSKLKTLNEIVNDIKDTLEFSKFMDNDYKELAEKDYALLVNELKESGFDVTKGITSSYNIHFGLKHMLSWCVTSNIFNNKQHNTVDLEFSLEYDNKNKYSNKLNEKISSHVNELIKQYKEDGKLTVDEWSKSIMNIVYKIKDMIEEEEAAIAIEAFADKVEPTKISQNAEEQQEIDNEFGWLY